jgi:hypothetical protein
MKYHPLMITVVLRGGLGNQMFEYAAGLALAKRRGTDLVLDTTYLSDRFPRRNFTYREFDLDIFTLTPRFTTLSKIANALPVPGLWLGLDLAIIKLSDILGIQKFFTEKDERVFDPTLLDAPANTVPWGRWQSEKYFLNVTDELRAAFTFRHPLEGEAKVLGEKIRSANSVSLHVRRGDYAAFKNVAQTMGDTNLAYYDRAAKYIGEHAKGPKFFVFSDDIDWCKGNIKLPFPMEYVSASSEGPKASYHLELMSLCKHNIVANSTFSWWGAWLNKNPQKIVIAPQHWYSDGRDPDIVPGAWTRL